MINMLVSVQMCEETNTLITSVVLENMKKGTSHYNKTIFEIRLAMYNLIYQAVRNIRHILSNYINNQCILSQIVNDNLLNSWPFPYLVLFLNLIISVMNIVYWMIAKLVMFGVWKLLLLLGLCRDIIITLNLISKTCQMLNLWYLLTYLKFRGKIRFSENGTYWSF
jgi:hypothetical protein